MVMDKQSSVVAKEALSPQPQVCSDGVSICNKLKFINTVR